MFRSCLDHVKPISQAYKREQTLEWGSDFNRQEILAASKAQHMLRRGWNHTGQKLRLSLCTEAIWSVNAISDEHKAVSTAQYGSDS